MLLCVEVRSGCRDIHTYTDIHASQACVFVIEFAECVCVCVCVHVYVCVCMCMCVCARGYMPAHNTEDQCDWSTERESESEVVHMRVCVCLCENERECAIERKPASKKENK